MARKFLRHAAWRRLRRKVLIRANHTCVRCGRWVGTGFNANVHHIIPRDEDEELELEEGNCVALCRSCHSAIHADDRYRQSLIDQEPIVDIDGRPLQRDHPWNGSQAKARRLPRGCTRSKAKLIADNN